MDHGRHGPLGQPVVRTVYIINAGPAATLNQGMEDFTAREGTRPALFAPEGCVGEISEKTRLKTHGQKTVSSRCENILQ